MTDTLSHKLAIVLAADRTKKSELSLEQKFDEFIEAVVLLVCAHEQFDPFIRTKVARKLMLKVD